MSIDKSDSSESYDEILEAALTLSRERYPQASAQKHAAFANSVATLVTGWSGGYGGPSVREHAIGHTYPGGSKTYEEATALLLDPNGLIFGPITDLHRYCFENEHCFDDDPEDLALLQPTNTN